MILIRKAAELLVSSFVGLVAGTVVATPVIALANYLASDGPYFSPPLVAFVLLALPIMVLLLFVQAPVVAYEAVARRNLGAILPALGVVAGTAAGLIWYLVLVPDGLIEPLSLLATGALAAFQGACIFGCHWLLQSLQFTLDGSPRPQA